MSGYTIIIPTMWKSIDYLYSMMIQYEKCPLVDEVIVINNATGGIDLPSFYANVRMLGDGTNLYVNPSWNLGVLNAKSEKIILANDDIYINNFNATIEFFDKYMKQGRILGFAPTCFSQKRNGPLPHLNVSRAGGNRTYGFGVFMSMFKGDYAPIPEELKIWYGDELLYNKLEPFLITGIDVVTNMRTTSKTMNLNGQKVFEKEFYNKLKA